MNQQTYRAFLFETLKNLANTEKWLRRSYRICLEIGVKPRYTEEEFDAFETLTSRFARTADLIVNKVLRALDRMEFEYHSGTLIDVMNRAVKRELIHSIDDMREIKELRNTIAHDYTETELEAVFKSVLILTPELFKLAENIREHCKKF